MKIHYLKYQYLFYFLINFAHSCTSWDKSELKTTSAMDPLATSFDIRMVYTDSLKINSILTAPKHEDFRNLFLNIQFFQKA